jgi:hypothetical protein
MDLASVQQVVYSIVMGEDEPAEDLMEDINATEKSGQRAGVRNWVKQHHTPQLTILLSMEPGLQESFIEDYRCVDELGETGYSIPVKVEFLHHTDLGTPFRDNA